MSFLRRVATVLDNLYLSGAAAVTPEVFAQYNIKCIINITLDVPSVAYPGITSYKVAVDDNIMARLAPHFDRCIDQVEKTRREGGNTLVHCKAGASRSATICIAYLMKIRGFSLRQAYYHVKDRRPIIRPNVGFFRQLISYEKSLFGQNSVKMVSSPIGHIPDVYEHETRNMVYVPSSRMRSKPR